MESIFEMSGGRVGHRVELHRDGEVIGSAGAGVSRLMSCRLRVTRLWVSSGLTGSGPRRWCRKRVGGVVRVVCGLG